MTSAHTKKITHKSTKKLKDQLWKLFSRYVRSKDADWRGYVACVTCGQQYIWDSGMIHAGHWIHDKLDYDLRNVHPQCRNCNFKYNKNTNTNYAIYMAKTYGYKEMEKIRKLADSKGNNYTILEIEEMIEFYKKELNKTL